MSLFPFLIVVTAIAGFFGSKDLADEVARILLAAGRRGRRADRGRNPQRADHRAWRRAHDRRGAGVYFASSGVESLRIGLNRAYNITEPRSWWRLQLESIGYVPGA